jgi:hypothetical protein
MRDPPLVPGAVPAAAMLLLCVVVAGNPTVPVTTEGVPVKVFVINGGTMPEFDAVSVSEAIEAANADVIEGGTKPEFETVSVDILDWDTELDAGMVCIDVTDPNKLSGMADPTPELVNGVGKGSESAPGLSAGLSA